MWPLRRSQRAPTIKGTYLKQTETGTKMTSLLEATCLENHKSRQAVALQESISPVNLYLSLVSEVKEKRWTYMAICFVFLDECRTGI